MRKKKKKLGILMIIIMLVISPIIFQTAYAEEATHEIKTSTSENQVNGLNEVTEEVASEEKEEPVTEEEASEEKEVPVTEEEASEEKEVPVTKKVASEEKEEPVTEEEVAEPRKDSVTEKVALEAKKEPVKKESIEVPKVKIQEESKHIEETKKQKKKAEPVKKTKMTIAADSDPDPDATKGFKFNFDKLLGDEFLYELGTKFPNAILIDVKTDENYNFIFSVISHEVYNNRLTYAVARAGIGATDVPFSQDIVLNIPKDVSYKYVEGQLLNNYQINLRAYGLDEEDEVDTGFIRINKQRNTAEIKMDQKENPTSIIFENSGDADNKEYAWEILDAEGNVVISGTEDAVPSDKLDNLPKGEYTVNLTTMGKSQFGNELQEKIATDIFEIVHGDLVVIHKLVDKDGVETTYGEPLNKDGRVGSSYNTEQEYPPGYKLVEVPANATGEYTKETITVEYIYEIIRPKLTVNYVDEDGNELEKQIVSIGVFDEEYETENKEFEGYELIEIPSNASGRFGEEDITVTYVYRLIESKLTVNYVDEKGVKLADSSISKGKFGEVYETEKKKIKGYELVEIPANASGKHGEEDITVTYVYRLIESKLTVNYVDEDGNKLAEPIKSIGKYGEEYSTEKKEFEGYELVAVPSNASGEYGEEDITVTYVYRLIDDETPIPGGGGGEEGGTETGGNGTAVPKPSNPGSGNGSNSGGSGGSINNPSSLPGSESLAQLPQTGADNFAIMGYLGGLLVVIGAVFIIFRRRSANE